MRIRYTTIYTKEGKQRKEVVGEYSLSYRVRQCATPPCSEVLLKTALDMLKPVCHVDVWLVPCLAACLSAH